MLTIEKTGRELYGNCYTGTVEQNTVHGNQCPERKPIIDTWRIAKIITRPDTRNGSPNTSAHSILASESPRKAPHSQALDGTRLLVTW